MGSTASSRPGASRRVRGPAATSSTSSSSSSSSPPRTFFFSSFLLLLGGRGRGLGRGAGVSWMRGEGRGGGVRSRGVLGCPRSRRVASSEGSSPRCAPLFSRLPPPHPPRRRHRRRANVLRAGARGLIVFVRGVRHATSPRYARSAALSSASPCMRFIAAPTPWRPRVSRWRSNARQRFARGDPPAGSTVSTAAPRAQCAPQSSRKTLGRRQRRADANFEAGEQTPRHPTALPDPSRPRVEG